MHSFKSSLPIKGKQVVLCQLFPLKVYPFLINVNIWDTHVLTITTLLANLADSILKQFSNFSQKTGFNILCKLSHDSLHEMSKPIFPQKSLQNIKQWGPYLSIWRQIERNATFIFCEK